MFRSRNITSIQTGGDSAATNLRTATYTPDALNPYTAITQPGFLEIYGKAPIAQAVTMNALASIREGRDFCNELAFAACGAQSIVPRIPIGNDTRRLWRDRTSSSGKRLRAPIPF